jgi:hypothetical protein
MVTRPLRFNREQVARIVGSDPDAIRQFEGLVTGLNGAEAAIDTYSTMAEQSADDVAITGGTIAGVALSGLAAPLAVADGGTGQVSYTDGQLLIGSAMAGLVKAALTAGANIQITNGAGAITIAVTGLGTMAFQNIGVTGTFTAGANTVTVTNGIVTDIA